MTRERYTLDGYRAAIRGEFSPPSKGNDGAARVGYLTGWELACFDRAQVKLEEEGLLCRFSPQYKQLVGGSSYEPDVVAGIGVFTGTTFVLRIGREGEGDQEGSVLVWISGREGDQVAFGDGPKVLPDAMGEAVDFVIDQVPSAGGEPFGLEVQRSLYILDSRDVVGNCASWWRPNGEGYTCEIDEAGVWDEPPSDLRPTDFVVPKELVDRHTVKHVRLDGLRGEPEVADQFRALRKGALEELQREVDCLNCGDCGYVACGDPECFICAMDNERRCPNSEPCPKCNPDGKRSRVVLV